MIRVLIVEEVPLFRCGIRATLERTGACLVLEATELTKIAELAQLQQPDVAITWGNHDADWIAASLGHLPAIATVCTQFQTVVPKRSAAGCSPAARCSARSRRSRRCPRLRIPGIAAGRWH